VTERTCSKCGVSKPEAEEFFRRRGTKDRGGLRPDCRDCSAARDKAYYQANREAVLAAQKANPQRRLAWQRTYKRTYYQTPEGRATIRRANHKWQTSEVGRAAMVRARHRRRSKMAEVEWSFTAEDWAACLEWFDNKCAYCATAADLHQEHVIPLEHGGPYVPGNIVPACGSCNSSKTTKPLDEWFAKQTFYTEERMAMIAEYLLVVSGSQS
jgi:5-methylcytosine-specific restriction endonuclease McrA